MNHIKDLMNKLSGSVVSKYSALEEISKIFSSTVGVIIPTSMIRISGNRIRLSCSPAVRQIVYLRKEELLATVAQRLNGMKYYLD